MSCCCARGLEISNYLYAPERAIHDRLGNFYKNHPYMSRVIATPLAAIDGALKVVLFPVISAIGTVVLPLIGLIQQCRGKGGGDWLKAWSFSVLGLTASIAFVGLVGYTLPILYTFSAIFLILSLSITAHVYLFLREPRSSLC